MVKLWLMKMKKIIILLLFFVMISIRADAQYKRKIREPNFFIPEGSQLHKPEKLPQIKLPEKEVVKEDETEDKAEVDGTKQEIVANNVNVGKVNKSLIDIRETPPYKYKYDEYIRDIESFYKNGVMPENAELEKDLAEMNSDTPKEVTAPAPTQITSKEMGEFYKIYQKSMDN